MERLTSYWAKVFGGPASYTQLCGAQSAMLGIYAHQGMEVDLGGRFVGCFVQAAGDAGLPDDPEMRTCLRRTCSGRWTRCSPTHRMTPSSSRRGCPFSGGPGTACRDRPLA